MPIRLAAPIRSAYEKFNDGPMFLIGSRSQLSLRV
jgi:hypothetical protein